MTGEGGHLSPTAQSVAALSPEARLAHLRGQWWIAHPHAQAALARLETVLQFGPGKLRPPNLLIVGPTNNGKSMIAEKFRRLHPPRSCDCGNHEVVPVVTIQMPTEPNVRRFYAAILAALNAPVSSHLPGERLERTTLSLLRAVQVQVLVIDELHNLLAGTQSRRAEFLNMLRFLGNELRVPIVGIGTKQAQIAIRSDDQLENRFEPIPLPRWQDDELFARLLASFEAALPLRMPSEFAESPELRSIVLRRSGGLIGEVAAMLTAATVHALQQGREQIDKAVLDQCDYRGPDERRAMFDGSFANVR